MMPVQLDGGQRFLPTWSGICTAAMAVVLCLLAACAAPDKNAAFVEQEPRPYEMHVVHHGWHTGLVLSAHDFRQMLPQLAERFPHAAYLEFGWGDEAFYQADRVSVGLALRALFLPTDSVMHVVGLPQTPERYFSSRPQEKFCLTRRQYAALVEFVVSSFLQSPARSITPLEKGLYGDSQFYRARGKYHFLNTCNTWTARGLRTIGMPITPGLMVTAQSIMDFLHSESEKDPGTYEGVTAACR